MASEMINKVLAAEKAAADREAEARNKAADKVSAAEAEAKASLEQASAAAAEEKEKILAEAAKRAEEIYAKSRADSAQEQEDLKTLMDSKRDAAVSAVIHHIIPS